LPESVITQAYEEDEASASAEYGALFRRDIEVFVSREAVEAVVIAGRVELPPEEGKTYRGFVDPSGGSADSMTLAIAHRDRDRAVLDCLREVKPPFSPDAVVQEFCGLLKSYGVTVVLGDRYAGEWPPERFRTHGVVYQVSEKTKSEIYLDTLPLLNSHRVELLDDSRLKAQLLGLERRTSRAGRDSVDHAPNGHDDVANAVAGALLLAASVAPVLALDNAGLRQESYWNTDFSGRRSAYPSAWDRIPDDLDDGDDGDGLTI
jgi:hypothetical protein